MDHTVYFDQETHCYQSPPLDIMSHWL